MLSLVYKQGIYWVFHSKSLRDDSFKNHADHAWRIVKYESVNNRKVNYFKVVEGDTIKFGRVRFRIKKLVVDQSDIEHYREADDDELNDMASSSLNKNNRNQNDQSMTQNVLRAMTTENENPLRDEA